MTTAIFIIFCIVYLGMILGGLPFLQLDRTGIALLGAIALIGVEAVSPEQAARSIHPPTLLLLFSFMVVSAQMRLGGFYTWVTRRLAALPLSAPMLLAALIVVVAALSAVFSKRHRLPRRRSGPDRGLSCAQARPGTLSARARLRRQRRLRGDLDRQSAEHADRRNAETFLRGIQGLVR